MCFCEMNGWDDWRKVENAELRNFRSIKYPCPVCAAARESCLCAALPRIELATKVCLVIHHRELTRSSNTGLLAARALVNSEVRVRGADRETLDLKNLVMPQYRTFMLYPSRDALDLDYALAVNDARPIQLIVPDGTWRQARKLHSRHAELNDIARVQVNVPGDSGFQLRAQSQPGRMATLQAIAHALGVIEGSWVRDQLMKLYHAKVERTLIGRGILPRIRESPGEPRDVAGKV
jgi:DTW domain-containing protein